MKTSLVFMVAPLLAFAADPQPAVFNGRIERRDPAFDQLVAPNVTMEKIADGYTWAEGPLWFGEVVLFSDVPENTVYRWKPGLPRPEVFLKPSGQLTPAPGFREKGSNGLARDAQGRLLLAQHGERRVARYEGGKFTAVADRYDGKRFNSPNDLVVRANGDIYFTDPPYGLEGVDQSPLRELPFHGVYRVTSAGVVTLESRDVRFPNGLAFSPDEKILYVGSTDARTPHLEAFDVQADGSLANRRTFFDVVPIMADGTRGGCDGLKVDRAGNLWTTGPGGVLVISPTGQLLGRLLTGVPTANCGWGEDGSVLYITANHFLLRVKTLTRGAGW